MGEARKGLGGSPWGSRTYPVAATVVVDVGSGWRISSPALLGEGMSPKTSMVSTGREEPWELEKPVPTGVKAVVGRKLGLSPRLLGAGDPVEDGVDLREKLTAAGGCSVISDTSACWMSPGRGRARAVSSGELLRELRGLWVRGESLEGCSTT